MEKTIEIVIIIGTVFTSVVMLLAGILVLIIQKKRISARQELHEEKLRNEREKYQNEILVQERTLRDFGKTLHDDFGPMLTSLKVYLEVIAKGLDSEHLSKANASIASMKSSIDETMTKIRNTSRILYPVSLERYGLSEALRSLAKSTAEQYPIAVEYQDHLPDGINFGQVRDIIIYRLVQELLHNAVKYSQATKVEISLSANTFEIELHFRDNGIGIPEAMESEGVGLIMSRSRIESLNGRFEMVLNEQPGAAFEVTIPLMANND